MKKLLLFISLISISAIANANTNTANNAGINTGFVAQVIHVTSVSWCGTVARYDYTPKDGMSEQQIDNEIALINSVIENNTCPTTYFV